MLIITLYKLIFFVHLINYRCIINELSMVSIKYLLIKVI